MPRSGSLLAFVTRAMVCKVQATRIDAKGL